MTELSRAGGFNQHRSVREPRSRKDFAPNEASAMTKIRTVALSLCLATAYSGLARSQAFQTPPRQTFEQLDANGDGTVEKGEVPDRAKAAFDRLLKLGDADKDGKLQSNEFHDLILSMRNGDPASPGNNLGMFAVDPMGRFKALDKNGDGKVSREEFTGRPAMFERVDVNRDGFLEAGEVKALVASASKQAAAPAGPQPGSRIMAMDKDGDGKVSRDEYRGAPALFDRLDANGDGFVNKDEAAEASKVVLEVLRGMDSNGDGRLSRDEFRGAPERFAQLDADKDGFVEFNEIRAGPPVTPAPSGAAKKAEFPAKKD
jgi:Ca2+-binding EF-hand superfamily protein